MRNTKKQSASQAERSQLFIGAHNVTLPVAAVWLPRAHPDAEPNTNCLCFQTKAIAKMRYFSSKVETMNWEKPRLFLRDWVEHSFKTLVVRTIREQRCEERRFAEQRTTKHQLQARKSCIRDARSYRVARRLPLLVNAQF
jgi:hypothetical protein